MSATLTKGGLTATRRRLLGLLQEINFGRIENLTVRGGQPVFDPSPRVVREVKFGADHGPRPERAIGDFALKTQVLEMFAAFDRLGTGVIDVVEVKNGLPFKMEFAATVC